MTYASECHLQVSSCSQQKKIRVAWPGTCGMYTIILCACVIHTVPFIKTELIFDLGEMIQYDFRPDEFNLIAYERISLT